MYTQNNKVCNLAELTGYIKDGDTVAIGGGLSGREPMVAIAMVEGAKIVRNELTK